TIFSSLCGARIRSVGAALRHDLALAAERADRIMVFRQGEIQEQGATETIVQRPQHPYTQAGRDHF
ncbi:hypothetical protein FK513_28465, partial [Klebsiella pneumoniae]|nr:hypothetical protein [Klebsiella pneumoniae]